MTTDTALLFGKIVNLNQKVRPCWLLCVYFALLPSIEKHGKAAANECKERLRQAIRRVESTRDQAGLTDSTPYEVLNC